MGAELVKARVAYWGAVLRRTLPTHRKQIVELIEEDRRTRDQAPKIVEALRALDRRRTPRSVRAAAEILADADSPCVIAHEIAASMHDHQVIATRQRLSDLSAHMVECNIRLVIHQVLKRRGTPRDLEDSVSDGALGLIRAVELWDPRRGLRFSTYATHWIKHGLLRGMQNHGRTVRVPSHALSSAVKIKRASAQIVTELGREPTDEELSAKTKIPVSSLRLGKLALSQGLSSLDDPESLGSARTIRETLVSTFPDPESALLEEERRAFLDEVLKDFGPPRYRMILAQRFGLDGDPKTLEAVGQELGLSRERVRQLERDALELLRTKLERLGIGRMREDHP